MSKSASKKYLHWILCALVLALFSFGLSGCFQSTTVPEGNATPAPIDDGTVSADAPPLPEKLQLVDGVPQITVFNTKAMTNQDMDIERYVEGVLAGEMRNDWPMEALKAQAILARTFVVKFVDEKESQYDGADISTDIKEAQAYDEDAVNDRIKKAVEETRGLILVSENEFPYTWFHAHAGGQTEFAKAGLDYKPEEPPYTQSVESPDSDKAPTAVKQWTASFTADEVQKAAEEAGAKVGTIKTIAIGEKGESGRAITLLINGESVSAPSLRLALDSKKLKSVLLSSVSLSDGKVTFEGKGYGHGVGMSQWGAYGMAEAGKDAQEIVKYYFKDVQIARLWK